MVKFFAVLLSSALLVIPSVFGQQIFYEPVVRPLGSTYRVHRTPHFEIIFEEGNEIEAWQTALILERKLPEAQALSGPARRMWMPVVLNNSNDRSNGFVHTHPFRQEIEIPHIKGTRLGARFDSWIEAVVTHELVHAAQGQADGPLGWGKILNWFAPDAARAVNLSLPPGLNEGAAVYFESMGLQGAGRLNDARFQMQFRAAAAAEHPWSLSQMMERSEYGFHANRHYVGGANFFAWQHSRDQGDFFKQMRTRRYRNPLRQTGHEFRHATDQTLKELIEGFRQETTPEPSRHIDPSQVIASEHGVTQRWPQWLNDSTLLVYRKGFNETPGIYRLDLNHAKISLLHPVRLPEDAWFYVTGNSVLYSRYVPDRFSSLASTADIFKYDLATNQEIRITWGARSHMPVQTSSGIWALQNDGQHNTLIRVDADGHIQTLFGRSQADLIQIAPGKAVNAILVRHSRLQGIYRIGPDGELTPWIFLDDGTIRELSWSSDGQTLLFTADVNGVTNVYSHDLNSARTVRLTNALYGALDPVLSRDEQTLYYVDYQHEQYHIVSKEFSPENAPEVFLTPADQVPEIPAKLELPDDFVHEPYTLSSRLLPRMLLPAGSWSNETPEKELGLRGGLALYGSDPLGRVTYRTQVALQSDRLWGRAEISSVFGPMIATLDVFNEPGAIRANVIQRDGQIKLSTFGEQVVGLGVRFAVPLRFEANVQSSYARILLGLQSERSRWFSLDNTEVPYRTDSGQSLSEWERSVRFDTGVFLALGLQQNIRDVWPNRGAAIGVYGRADVRQEGGPRRVGLYIGYNQFWSFSRKTNTSMKFGADLLMQNTQGVYNSSLVLPRGHESFLGQGTHARVSAEILHPVWFVEDGFLNVPMYFKVIYLYGFTERLMVSKSYRGRWSSGIGMGIQFRLLHYVDVEVRASINPLDPSERYFTFM